MSRIMLAVCVMIGLTLCAQADVVELTNGDRVTGKIVTMAEGKMTVETAMMGAVTIDLANVATFSTDEPIKLAFGSGTVLNEKIVGAEAGNFSTAEGGTVQPQTFALSELAAINPPPPAKPEWKGSATAGFTKTTGNTDTTTWSADLTLSRRGEDDRITLGGIYQLSEDDGTTTRDQWRVNGKYDYFFTEKFYGFLNGSYEKDRIANLDARAIGGLGVGYQWVESDVMNFNTDAGLAFLHEEYSSPDETTNAITAQAGYHFDRKLIDSLTFLHDFRIYPELGSPADFRLSTSAELRAAINKVFFSSFKVLLDHNSAAPSGVDKTDVIYIIGIGANF